jgi:hypothetical protein
MKTICLFLFAAISALQIHAQGTAFLMKGGMTIGTQRWNGTDGSLALLAYHGTAAAEFLGGWKGEGAKLRQSSFGLQGGYHLKGSAVRVRFIDPANPDNVVRDQLRNEFHNASALLYAKGAYKTNAQSEVYYLMGLRVDYTFKYAMLMQGIDRYVNKFNYGVTLGGGFTYYIPNSRLGVFIEASISPDISRQIFVPAGIPVVYQIDGNTYSYPSQELKIHNLIFEVSLGFKLLPPVYVADPEDVEVE